MASANSWHCPGCLERSNANTLPHTPYSCSCKRLPLAKQCYQSPLQLRTTGAFERPCCPSSIAIVEGSVCVQDKRSFDKLKSDYVHSMGASAQLWTQRELETLDECCVGLESAGAPHAISAPLTAICQESLVHIEFEICSPHCVARPSRNPVPTPL